VLNKDQHQHLDSQAIAIQAGGDVHITSSGLSYSEVVAIAQDVFNSNFYRLSEPAMQIAEERAKEITNDFLNKLQSENPNGLTKAQDPDFQYALFSIQKQYARVGDRDLGDLLVDLLVDRSKSDTRDILQIVLNESLETAPKLTREQLACLSIMFLFKYTSSNNIGNHELLGEYFDKMVLPFSSEIITNAACYQHLEFTGCGSISLGSRSLEEILEINYPGLFRNGFDENALADCDLNLEARSRLIVKSLNDSSKYQINAISKTVLYERLEKESINDASRQKINELFDAGKMSNEEVRNKCISIRPFMEGVFQCWSESYMQSLTLTSVGIAIGHGNMKRLVGEFANLALWIN
jgi:hypothetical protein